MNKTYGKLTLYFDGQFWVGVFERTLNDKLSVSKVIFGAEPKDTELLDFILTRYESLLYSPNLENKIKPKHKNPKRLLKEAKKESSMKCIGTKSQQALKLQQEERKKRKQLTREERKEIQKKKYIQHQEKRKEKHKGH